MLTWRSIIIVSTLNQFNFTPNNSKFCREYVNSEDCDENSTRNLYMFRTKAMVIIVYTLFLSIRRSSVVQSLIISNADWRDDSSYSKPTCKKISCLVPDKQQKSLEGLNLYPKCWQGTQVSPWSAISSPHFQKLFKSHLNKPNKCRFEEIPERNSSIPTHQISMWFFFQKQYLWKYCC